jgi:hypothetical protein
MIPVGGRTGPGSRARPANPCKWIPNPARRVHCDVADFGVRAGAMSREVNNGAQIRPSRIMFPARGRQAAPQTQWADGLVVTTQCVGPIARWHQEAL